MKSKGKPGAIAPFSLFHLHPSNFFSLDQPTVRPIGREVIRLIQEPDPLPLQLDLPQILDQPAVGRVPDVQITTPLVNGGVGVRIDPGGEFDTAIAFVVEDGRITRMYAIRNPQKLGRLDVVAALGR